MMKRGRPKCAVPNRPRKHDTAKEIMTAREVALYLKVHTETVYRFVTRGDLPAVRFGSDL
jgi:excisionase family DNA binding protein